MLQAQLAHARAIVEQAAKASARSRLDTHLFQTEPVRTLCTAGAHLLAMLGCALEPAGAGPAEGAGKVLLADDVAMNRDIARLFLGSAGYEVACAEDGAAAAEMAAGADFRVVLMDVRMPRMDGLEATRRIRAVGGARGAVPVVALTAQVFAEQIACCLDAGMDTHVAKPFTLETLLEAILRGVQAGTKRAPAGEWPRPLGLSSPVAPAALVLGAKLPVLDAAVLNRTSALLTPEAVASYLDTLAYKAEGLQRGLGLRGDLQGDPSDLAEAAHALAGSAGMFGFERLVFMARHFERAVRSDPTQATLLADDLDAALEASLEGMRSRAHQGLQLQQV